MGSWWLGMWSFITAIFGMMLDVAQFWKQVSTPSMFARGRLAGFPSSHRRRPRTDTKLTEVPVMVELQVPSIPALPYTRNSDEL